MKEKQIKRLYVTYFRSNGETYRVEEEYVPSYYNQYDMEDEIINNRIRYKGMDFVILDGGDNVRPYFNAYLHKADKILKGSKGFG